MFEIGRGVLALVLRSSSARHWQTWQYDQTASVCKSLSPSTSINLLCSLVDVHTCTFLLIITKACKCISCMLAPEVSGMAWVDNQAAIQFHSQNFWNARVSHFTILIKLNILRDEVTLANKIVFPEYGYYVPKGFYTINEQGEQSPLYFINYPQEALVHRLKRAADAQSQTFGSTSTSTGTGTGFFGQAPGFQAPRNYIFPIN